MNRLGGPEDDYEVVDMCKNGEDYLPNPAKPGTFFQCSNGVAYLMPCPDGMVFNPYVRPGPVCEPVEVFGEGGYWDDDADLLARK